MSPFDSGRDERADPQDVIPAKQAVSKRHRCEAQTPEIVIPAKAGIQGGWAEVPHNTKASSGSP